jgi:hypothetical protein
MRSPMGRTTKRRIPYLVVILTLLASLSVSACAAGFPGANQQQSQKAAKICHGRGQFFCLVPDTPAESGTRVHVEYDYRKIGEKGDWLIVQKNIVTDKTVSRPDPNWLKYHRYWPMTVIHYVPKPWLCLDINDENHVVLGSCNHIYWVWRDGDPAFALVIRIGPVGDGPPIPILSLHAESKKGAKASIVETDPGELRAGQKWVVKPPGPASVALAA